ncbi:EamA family transporter [Pantoea coffeiphila]|uniref:EamA family transporter n=1 Tax=Pantoea coffeiphila TaxID=1465635 RepID=UPI001EF94BFA|nr:DMT family transporter [Pantoea coffeiphila]
MYGALRTSEAFKAKTYALLALLGSIFFLGIGTSLAKKYLFPTVGPQGTTALRLGFSALFMMISTCSWRMQLNRSDWKKVFLYGAALGGMNYCFYMSIKTLPFGLAVAIQFSGPLSLTLFSLRRKITLVWISLAVAGLSVLLPLRETSSADPEGVMYALFAAVMWALYIQAGKRLGHISAVNSVALGLIIAACFTVPVGVVSAGASLFSWHILAAGACIGLIASALPATLEMIALKRVSRGTFGIMTSLEPAVAAVMGFIVLHEQLGNAQWGAILMIIFSSMGCMLTSDDQELPTDRI